MNTSKIVVHSVDRYHCRVIFDLFGKPVCQARETAHCEAHCEVLALHIARGDVGLAGVADAYLGYNLDDWAWGVSFGAVLPVVAVQISSVARSPRRGQTFPRCPASSILSGREV